MEPDGVHEQWYPVNGWKELAHAATSKDVEVLILESKSLLSAKG